MLRDWSLDSAGAADSNASYFSVYSSLSLTVLALSCSANIIGQVSSCCFKFHSTD